MSEDLNGFFGLRLVMPYISSAKLSAMSCALASASCSAQWLVAGAVSALVTASFHCSDRSLRLLNSMRGVRILRGCGGGAGKCLARVCTMASWSVVE
jgi:hypothetical protein